MSLDQRGQILSLILSARYGVREMIQKLKWKSSRVISLLEQMKTEGLVELDEDVRTHTMSRKGRPKKIMICSSLGYEFLETYQKLRTKPLRARKEDFNHSVKDALYTQRLVSNGHSPYRLFMELNTIVRNTKISSQATSAFRE